MIVKARVHFGKRGWLRLHELSDDVEKKTADEYAELLEIVGGLVSEALMELE